MKRKRSRFDLKLFLGITAILIAIVFLALAVLKLSDGEDDKGEVSSINSVSSDSSETQSYIPPVGAKNLDPDYERLILVNPETPLPEDYDYEGNLTEVDRKYLNGVNTKLDKDVLPYFTAMIDAAWRDGVEMYICSPYRSVAYQQNLFNRQIERQMGYGLNREEAEKKAATIVARPKTSEHHTGLAADINCADDSFEQQEAYTWLKEHAEDYGFIMRYEGEKQPITGIIKESWHWRFVGIRHAKEMNEKGLCLEEYLDYLQKSGSKK